MLIDKINTHPDELTEREVTFLYRNWSSFFIKQFISKGFSNEDAEDIVQAAYLHLWENRHLYNNEFSVYTFFFKQIRRAVHLFLKQQRRTEQSIQAVRASGEDYMYDFLDDEQDEDLIQLVLDTLPKELSDFTEAYLSCPDRKSVVRRMEDLGYRKVSDTALWGKLSRYMKSNEPRLYAEIRDLFYGKPTELPKTTQVRMIVQDLQVGDHITVFHNMRDRAAKVALNEEVLSQESLGKKFMYEKTLDYTSVTRTK